jgi:serine/threonine-protein kinase
MSLQSRYTILRKITDGGTAEIFLAKQHGAQGFEKMVVLKRIFTAFYADPQFRHMLVDEAHVAMTLNHSNIVQVLDLGEADGRYSLALELVDGWSLDKILRRAKAASVPFPPALALYVTAEVCRALGYAHAKARDGKPLGIVHRDISPHNVLLSAEGEVKLTDFGIAKAHNRKEQSLGNLIKGKISFMSPEQASGGEIDARSDLFSLGTMLYAMITRRLPFDAATDYETLMLVKSGDYLPPETARPGLNPELYRVIRKAMGKTPADRYQKADAMLIDVEQVMRLAFRPVGQTELQRWLADLGAKDNVPPLTREAPPETSGPPSTVVRLEARVSGSGPPAPPPAAPRRPTPPAAAGVAKARGKATERPARPSGKSPAAEDGQESGVVLDLADALEVSQGTPPPPPPARASAPAVPVVPAAPAVPATEIMREPPSFEWAAPWYRRRITRIAGGVLLLLVAALSAKALVRGGRRGEPPPGPAAVATPRPSPAAAPDLVAPLAPPVAASAVPTPALATGGRADAATASVGSVDAGAAAAAAKTSTRPMAEPLPSAERTPPAGTTVAVAAPPEPPSALAAPHEPRDEPQGAPAPKTGPDALKAPWYVLVSVKSEPGGTKVTTRKRDFGSTPISLRLRPGKPYDFTFSKDGYAPKTQRYVPTTGGPQGLQITLSKVSGSVSKKGSTAPKDGQATPQKKKEWWKFTR